jgi:Xaa-Pro dipeptidase
MALLDMGGEYRGYATDLTRSYPVNGKFTQEQRDVYTAVLEAQRAVLSAMKPGVMWPDMHQLAEKVILTHLLKMGVLNGTLEEVTAAHMGAVFMPHGLGHFFGLWTHDVGGYGPDHPERSKELGVCYLRTSRELKAGMCITVEPGCYFNQPVLAKARQNPQQRAYLNEAVLERFKDFGGVRLEDDVVVTLDGIENWTVIPTDIDDIEDVIRMAQF